MQGPARLIKVLLQHGWTEVVCKKHRKFRGPRGEILVISRSPSCMFATRNNLRFLKTLGYDYTKEVGL